MKTHYMIFTIAFIIHVFFPITNSNAKYSDEKAPPVINFTGTIKIEYTLKKAYPSFSSPVQMREEKNSYSCSVDITSCPDCIDKLNNPKVFQSIIENQTDYGILYGKTTVDSNGKRATTYATRKKTEYSDRFGEFLADTEINETTESNGGEIRFSIQPFVRITPEGIPIPDTQLQYCMIIFMGHSNDIYTKPETIIYDGTGNKSERISSDEMTYEKISYNEPFYPGGFNFDYREGFRSSEKTIIPLEIQSPGKLENYLKNPQGSHSFQLHGKYYENNEEEMLVEISVSLTFSVNSNK